MTLVLRDGVHAVRAGRQIILLDETTDRYLGLTTAQACALEAGAALPPDPALGSLMARGLLVASDRRHEIDLSPAKTRPARSLLEDDERPSWGIAATPGAALAYRRAQRAMSSGGLAAVLARLRRRKTRADRCAVHRVARRFLEARAWIPVTPVCLLDSLALLWFLDAHRLSADLVIGVKSAPFEAHCWVEFGDVALNEPVLRASAFTPILVA